MSNFVFWVIFWILVAIIVTGVILFFVGLEAPHKNKPENTVNYDTLKWVGVALLITGGVGMLIWLYFQFRNRSKSKNIEGSMLQEPLNINMIPSRSNSFNSNSGSRNNSFYNLDPQFQKDVNFYENMTNSEFNNYLKKMGYDNY